MLFNVLIKNTTNSNTKVLQIFQDSVCKVTDLGLDQHFLSHNSRDVINKVSPVK